MKLEKIVAKDFLSYDNFEYNFEEKPLMVQGVNLTDDKQKSSGSGKSSIPTMIEFCLTGDNSRSVRDIELIRFGCKESFLELLVSCDVRKEVLHIKWNIKAKGSNVLELILKQGENNWEEVSFSNVNDGKKWILNWLSISKEDLFNYFIINKTKFKSFFNSSNKDKVELINRFSDASLIDGIDEIDTTKLDGEYANKNSDISKTDGKLDLLKEQLQKELERDFETEFKGEKEGLEESVENLENKIDYNNGEISDSKASIKESGVSISKLKEESLEYELEAKKYEEQIQVEQDVLKEINVQLQEVQKLVDNFVAKNYDNEKNVFQSDIEAIELSIENKEEAVTEKEGKIRDILKAVTKIDVLLSGSITCPSCSHKFIQDSEKSVGQLNTMKEGAKKLHEKIDIEKDALNEQIQKIVLSIDIPKQGLKELDEKERKEIENKNNLLHAVNKVNEKINLKNGDIKAIQELLEEELDSINVVANDIDEQTQKINGYNQEIRTNQGEIELSKKEIAQNNKSIKALQKGGNEKEIDEIKKGIQKMNLLNIGQKKDLQELEDELFCLNQWKGNFKQFKLFVANKSIEIMQHHVNRYLEGTGSDLKVRFDGQKVLANGTIKDEITVTVIRDTERTFNSFSGGERGILMLASILSNRYLINNSNKYGGLDFLIIDEVLEGCDSLVLKSIVDELKKLQSAIMIITHISDEEVSSDVLKIVKRNGISKIEL